MNIKKIAISIFIIVSSAYSQNDLFLTLSTNKAKPIAMGSAYTSIEDNIVSATYNPASLNLYQRDKNFRLTFFMNPLTPIIMIADHMNKINQDDINESNQQYAKDAATFIKGIVVTAKFLNLALIFNEQLINRNELLIQKNFFKDNELFHNSYHTAVMRIKLAERVSIGASANLYLKNDSTQTNHFYGFNYGILVKPSASLQVGITYNYFPKSFPTIRLPLESLADQTVNVGVSYYPFKSTVFTVDLRNLTEEKAKNIFEPHFGFEQSLFSFFALRGGYYLEKPTNYQTYSCGIGLIDSNLFFSEDNQFSQPHFVLNYTFVHQQRNKLTDRWHLVSMSIRF